MGATRVGSTLGGFRILDSLGSGGAGMIWKAEDLALGRVVALKALRPELAGDDAMADRFRAEARALARLSHANVASLYSLMEADDAIHLVLEYVEGTTLAALLATSGPLPFDSCFALFHQVLDGISHAHEAGIVHRDLKPANLMVDARGRIKIMDFGIARIAGATRTTHHGKLVGTPEYMAPEQIRGEDGTIRSDVYSLGIVLYEMLTGQLPFRAPTSYELMRAQIEEAPVDPGSLRPDLDSRVSAALLRALAKLPAERFASARELQECLFDAGATRRGKKITSLEDLAPARAADEAPARPARGEASTTVVTPHTGELDLEHGWIDAQPEEREPGGAQDRAPADGPLASATQVLDSSAAPPDPAPLRPTLMLADASFATNARALRSPGAKGAASRRGPALLWAAVALALFGLAAGAVRLASHNAAEAEAQAPATIPAPQAKPAAVAEPPAPPPTPKPAAPAQTPPPEAPAKKASRPKERARERAPAPEAPPADDAGWVIRR